MNKDGPHWRMIRPDWTHNGFKYQMGDNRLKEEFNSSDRECCKGGLYFTDWEHLPTFFDNGCVIAKVRIGDNARVKLFDNKGRTDILFIEQIWDLYNPETWEELKIDTVRHGHQICESAMIHGTKEENVTVFQKLHNVMANKAALKNRAYALGITNTVPLNIAIYRQTAMIRDRLRAGGDVVPFIQHYGQNSKGYRDLLADLKGRNTKTSVVTNAITALEARVVPETLSLTVVQDHLLLELPDDITIVYAAENDRRQDQSNKTTKTISQIENRMLVLGDGSVWTYIKGLDKENHVFYDFGLLRPLNLPVIVGQEVGELVTNYIADMQPQNYDHNLSWWSVGKIKTWLQGHWNGAYHGQGEDSVLCVTDCGLLKPEVLEQFKNNNNPLFNRINTLLKAKHSMV